MAAARCAPGALGKSLRTTMEEYKILNLVALVCTHSAFLVKLIDCGTQFCVAYPRITQKNERLPDVGFYGCFGLHISAAFLRSNN